MMPTQSFLLAFALCFYCAGAMSAQTHTGPAPANPLLDHYGDPLPKHALLRIGTIRFTHGARIGATWMSADGKSVNAVDEQGYVRVWDRATGREQRSFRLKGDRFLSIVLSQDQTLLAGDYLKKITLWDAATGSVVRTITERPDEQLTLHMAFSSDGKTLMGLTASDRLVRWDVATGKKVGNVKLEEPKENRGADEFSTGVTIEDFSADAKLLAGSYSHGRSFAGQQRTAIYLWDASNGKLVRRIDGHPKYVQQVRFSPDGKLLASGGGGNSVRVWQVSTGKLLHEFKRCSEDNLTFSTDSKRLFTRGEEGGFHIYDLGSGKRVPRRFEEPKLRFGDGEFIVSQDAKTLVAHCTTGVGESSRLLLWDIATGKLLGERRDAPIPYFLQRVAYAADAQSVFLSDFSQYPSFSTYQYHLASGKRLATFPGTLEDVASDGKRLATSRPGQTTIQIGTYSVETISTQIGIYSVSTGQELWNRQLSMGLSLPEFSADGTKLVFQAPNQTLQVADAATGKTLREYAPLKYRHQEQGVLPPVRDQSVVYSPDLKYTASAKSIDDLVEVRDWKTGKTIHELEGFPTWKKTNFRLSFSPDAEHLLGFNLEHEQEPVVLWHIPTGKKAGKLPLGYQGGFTPDGKQVWLSSDEAILIWDIKSSQVLSKLSPVDAWTMVVFSPDSKVAATLRSSDVLIWEVATGKNVQTLTGERSHIWGRQFAPDHRTFLTISDTSALIWDLTGQWLALRNQPVKLAPEEFAPLWEKLASQDAAEAHRAIWRLVAASDEAIASLKNVLVPISAPDHQRVRKLIADLDSDRFAIREKAMQELLGLEGALPAVQKELAARPSLEARVRLEKVIRQLEDFTTSPARLRDYRALRVLEYAGTEQARGLLKSLASGVPGTVLTREADASLKRLAKQARN